ncbi:uncharacterized protein V1510DRAFT_434488 [Dipodascopsis tothii]|uniref:uncharacterized protein n=1 Tax=Dipodascopsis tothii TaxID=44089 RepID=UPI0034CE11A8
MDDETEVLTRPASHTRLAASGSPTIELAEVTIAVADGGAVDPTVVDITDVDLVLTGTIVDIDPELGQDVGVGHQLRIGVERLDLRADDDQLLCRVLGECAWYLCSSPAAGYADIWQTLAEKTVFWDWICNHIDDIDDHNDAPAQDIVHMVANMYPDPAGFLALLHKYHEFVVAQLVDSTYYRSNLFRISLEHSAEFAPYFHALFAAHRPEDGVVEEAATAGEQLQELLSAAPATSRIENLFSQFIVRGPRATKFHYSDTLKLSYKQALRELARFGDEAMAEPLTFEEVATALRDPAELARVRAHTEHIIALFADAPSMELERSFALEVLNFIDDSATRARLGSVFHAGAAAPGGGRRAGKSTKLRPRNAASVYYSDTDDDDDAQRVRTDTTDDEAEPAPSPPATAADVARRDKAQALVRVVSERLGLPLTIRRKSFARWACPQDGCGTELGPCTIQEIEQHYKLHARQFLGAIDGLLEMGSGHQIDNLIRTIEGMTADWEHELKRLKDN